MDFRNESPVVDLSVKKNHSASPLAGQNSLPGRISHPGIPMQLPFEHPQDLSAKGVPYFMQPFDPLRFANFNLYPNVPGLNLSKTEKHHETNGERNSQRAEKKSRTPEKHPPPIETPEKNPAMDPDSPERRRSLRPRAEVKYNVSPIPLLPEEVYILNGGYTNGVASDSDDDDSKPLPLLPLPKEIHPEEFRQKTKLIKKLQVELRQEEMLLYLLQGLKASQSLPPPTPEVVKEPTTPKELPKTIPPTYTAGHPLNLQLHRSLQPHNPFTTHLFQDSPSLSSHPFPQLANLAAGKSSRIGSVDISPVPPKGSNFGAKSGTPLPSPMATFTKVSNGSGTPPVRTSSVSSPLAGLGLSSDLPLGLSITPKGSSNQTNSSRNARSTPPVTPSEDRMNKFSMPGMSLVPQGPSSRSEDPQAMAQRQAAAKLALRKQLEKTLLQIPPPKPPPPEMHFIPNPSNTEFVYLLGLETVVDHLLPGNRKQDAPPPPTPFVCSQCKTDFSPVWKWDKKSAADKPSVMCDQCVTSSVKRALRAEHTARLKSAFMRALQQEQELEQHSSRSEPPTTPPVKEPPPPPSPRPSPLASPSPSVAAVNRERERMREREMREKAKEERHREKIERESRDRNRAMMEASSHMLNQNDFSKLMDPTKMFNHQAMAALQAAQQMILRAGMGMGSPQQMQAQAAANPLLNPFNPLLYPYQLALAASAAQQAQGGKGNHSNHQNQLPAMNHAALAELQRQILMEMIPTSMGHMPGPNQPSTSRQGSSKDRQRK